MVMQLTKKKNIMKKNYNKKKKYMLINIIKLLNF